MIVEQKKQGKYVKLFWSNLREDDITEPWGYTNNNSNPVMGNRSLWISPNTVNKSDKQLWNVDNNNNLNDFIKYIKDIGVNTNPEPKC